MTLATKTDKQATKIDQANYLVELKRKHSARSDEQVFLLPFFCVMPFERCVFFFQAIMLMAIHSIAHRMTATAAKN